MIARRRLLGAGVAVALGRSAVAAPAARVVVVGGGFGGATCARWLRRLAPSIAVTLIEPERRYVSCPFSNLALTGARNLQSLTFDYEALRAEGVDVRHDAVEDVDVARRQAHLASGGRLPWDRIVLAPGVTLNMGAIEGYGDGAAMQMPHAWRAGAQTALLGRQLRQMGDGGVVIIVAPPNPYRCPPGPYERASLLANWLTRAKPRSKILILDAKDEFTKGALFRDAWQALYPGRIEWVAGSAGGRVVRVDAASMRVHTEFDEFGGAVVNVIPPQLAGALVRRLGLDAGLGWCAVDPRTFEAREASGVHVIGDATIAAPMPKSAFAASSQARVCAQAVARALGIGASPTGEPLLMNTCYSLVAPDYGISITGAYRPEAGKLRPVPGTTGVSPKAADRDLRRREARHAEAWWSNLTEATFG